MAETSPDVDGTLADVDLSDSPTELAKDASTARVVGFAYLRAFMRPKTPKPTKNVDLTLINALLSTFSLLLSLLIETVKDESDLPAGLGNMLGAVSLLSIIVAVSITHVLLGPRSHSSWQVWQPFLGGWKFVTLQSIAWTLLSVSLFLSGLALHPSFSTIYPSHMFGSTFPCVWTLTCTLGILAEVLLVSSLPLFESPTQSSTELRWNDVGTINIIISVLAMLTFFTLEKLRPLRMFTAPHLDEVLLGIAGSCIVLAILITHLIVGKMCHGSQWKWWQAFEGGWRFILMQGLSWCLFSLAVVVGAWSIRNTVMHEGSWTLTGTLGFLSELLMVISIQFYLPSSSTSSYATPGSMQAWLNNAILLGKRARRFLVTVLLFNVFFAPIMVAMPVMIPFLFASPWVWGAVITFIVAVYTPAFFLTKPHRTGTMESAKLRTSFLVSDIIRYFNGKLVKTAELDTTKQYIFGYHPHGILPLAAMWATNSPSWKMFQTARDTVTLIASHLFCIPVTREFLAAAGAREVSKKSFDYALEQGKSVVLVPGGMKEMQHSISSSDEIVVCKSHKGFVRMAIVHGVDLVPMFSFGETKLLDCAFPELQKFCWRNLGIPFPLFVGRWGLPVPRPHQITILVGPAIPVKKNPEPTEEEIDAVWSQYFDALQNMFEKHKEECGHPFSTLVFK